MVIYKNPAFVFMISAFINRKHCKIHSNLKVCDFNEPYMSCFSVASHLLYRGEQLCKQTYGTLKMADILLVTSLCFKVAGKRSDFAVHGDLNPGHLWLVLPVLCH